MSESGGISVIHGGTGFWFVTFPGAEVWNRAVIVSLSRVDFVWPPGQVEATPCGGAPQGVSCTQSNNINTVLVNIGDSSGAPADQAFYLMIVD